MNIVEIINEEISKWYHGTPDVTGFKETGSFSPRTDSTSYISDPKKFKELQAEMAEARKSGNDILYSELLTAMGELNKNLIYKKPIYFTGNFSVAKTYADPWRSFDYQNAKPSVLTAKINDSGKILTISAHGESFRGIQADVVKNALMNDGVSESVIDNYFAMFQNRINNGRMSSETLSVIAQLLGYDIVDVLGVRDSYHGGKINSTIRIVFDPTRIKIS